MNAQAMGQAAGGAANLLKIALFGGAAVYGVSNSIFNVEGGHRAVVFNRLLGIKESVRAACTRAAAMQPHMHAPHLGELHNRCTLKARIS